MPRDLDLALTLLYLGAVISDSTVHTFTKISVGSQTDLQVLLAYVKELQNKLEKCEATAAVVVAIEEDASSVASSSSSFSRTSSPHEMVRSPSEMTVPEKVQLFESLSSSDLVKQQSLDVSFCSVPQLRFNSNGSILSTDERSIDLIKEEPPHDQLFIPSTPAKVATVVLDYSVVEDCEDDEVELDIELTENEPEVDKIDTTPVPESGPEVYKSKSVQIGKVEIGDELGDAAVTKTEERTGGLCCSIDSVKTVQSISPKEPSSSSQPTQSPPLIDCNFEF